MSTSLSDSYSNKIIEEQESRLQSAAKVFWSYLKALQNDMNIILQDSLSKLQEGVEIKNFNTDDIQQLFKDIIGKSIDSLSEELEKAYKFTKRETLLFDEDMTFKILVVMEKVLEFEKSLDRLYPNFSKKIIKSLQNLLVAVIATQLPMVAALIRISGILEKINNFMTPGNLLPKIQKWKDDINNKETSEELRTIYQKAEKIAELAEKIDVAPVKVVQLNLSDASLNNANKIITEIKTSMPKTEQEVNNTISKIKTDFYKNIDIIKQGSNDIKENAKNSITEGLSKVRENLLKVIDPEATFGEKISSLYEAVKNTLEIAKTLKKTIQSLPGGSALIKAVDTTMHTVVETIVPKSINDLAQNIAHIAGISNKAWTHISAITTSSKSHVRAM
jgi:hypothetical protein